MNKLMDNFLIVRKELLASESPIASLLKKKNVYRESVRVLEESKSDLFNQHGVTNTQEELGQTSRNVNRNNVELNTLIDTRLEAKTWLRYINKQLLILKNAPIKSFSFPYSFSGSAASRGEYYVDTEMKQQIEKIGVMQTEYATILLSYRSDTENVSMLEKELFEQKKRLVSLVNNRVLEKSEMIKILDQSIKNKELRISSYKQRARALNKVSSLEAELNTELSAANNSYFKFNQIYEEVRTKQLAQLNEFSNVRILSRATIPLDSSTPPAILLFILSILVSMIIAITLGLTREFFDRRFRHPEQCSSELGIPTIAIIDEFEPESELELPAMRVIIERY
ncbi:MAG: hypothetical protein JKY01_09480 [Pseudomonadales bacterium]|nr:hypothetical protein [Pseudomonadales bacterium]